MQLSLSVLSVLTFIPFAAPVHIVHEYVRRVRCDDFNQSPLLLRVQTVGHIALAQLIAVIIHGGRHTLGGSLARGGSDGGCSAASGSDRGAAWRASRCALRCAGLAGLRRSGWERVRSGQCRVASHIARTPLHRRQLSLSGHGLRQVLLLLRRLLPCSRLCLRRLLRCGLLRRLLLHGFGHRRPQSLRVSRHELDVSLCVIVHEHVRSAEGHEFLIDARHFAQIPQAGVAASRTVHVALEIDQITNLEIRAKLLQLRVADHRGSRGSGRGGRSGGGRLRAGGSSSRRVARRRPRIR